MFNALGIYSNPLPAVTHPVRGVGPLLPVIVAVGTSNGVGGFGNDIFNNGTINSGNGFTGSTGFTGSQGIPGPAGGFTGSQGAIGFTGSTGFTGSIGFTGSAGFTGSIGFTGSAGGLIVPVTEVTTTPYNALASDYYIAMNVPAPSVVNLPLGPTGKVYIVKDTAGLAGAPTNNTITVSDTALIDGVASALINTNYGSLTFIFNGTEWNIV